MILWNWKVATETSGIAIERARLAVHAGPSMGGTRIFEAGGSEGARRRA